MPRPGPRTLIYAHSLAPPMFPLRPDSQRLGFIMGTIVAAPTLNDWKAMYAALWRIRLFEGQVQRLAAAGEVPGFPHLSTGQEAVAVGICMQLAREDVLFTSHRGHGHVLAKGSDIEATFAEILGRRTGLCG